ncbi:TonB-dependent outermembrane copper receptor OprC [Alcanivorax hongdengensis A-11-3]|uniref:TonB-dependent outermembrane copper receptor OprC n=1 Tax=Alcanivorax hongdengensis A-11-3 TaxID=1177179 RepID=L0WCQ9_9GAMM|nr:TonB-dependent outermembrane copper receptor OprC [Alcanivorax hongdengensis A-11-3]
MSERLLLVGLGLGLLSAAGAQAQSADNRLAPVVITSVAPQAGPVTETNPKTPRQPVPASDAADYLKTIPGFSAIRSGGSNGDPVLRGQFGSRINLLVDGGEMIGACPNRMDAPSSYIAPENFDRLTVIKGPQSVQWGPVGSAGTVLFERDPEYFSQPDVMVDAQLLGGSYGRSDQRLDATLGNRLGYLRLAGNHSRSGDYEDGNGDTVPSRWDKWNTDMAVGWTPDADSVIELTAGTGDGEARYAGRGMDGSQFKRESLGLRVDFRNLGDVLDRMEGRVYYNYADHVMDNYSLRTPSGTGMMAGPMAADVDRRTLGGRFKLTWQGVHWQALAGVDAQTSEHRERSAMGVDAYLNEPWARDAEFQQYGFFTELRHDLGEQDRLIAGVRVDANQARDYRDTLGHGMMAMPNPTRRDTRNDTLPSGFVRYERNLSAHSNYYVGIGHVARFPDYWELFSPDQGPEGSANAFAGIEPEKTTQLDIGSQYRKGRLEIWTSAYAGQVNDYILFDYQSSMMGYTTRAENIDAVIAGAELGGRYRFTPQWSGDASLAYAWGENRDDHQALPQMPPLEARFTATYERGAWSAAALWRVVAAQHRTAVDKGNVVGRDLGDSAGFAVVSVNGAYRLNEQFTVSAGVDNLFDRAYAEHLNLAGNAGFGFPSDTRINEPGRLLWAKLDWRY